MIEKKRRSKGGHDLFLTEIDAHHVLALSLLITLQWTKSITISVINLRETNEPRLIYRDCLLGKMQR